MNEPGKSLDIFGVKPVADSVSTVVTAATAGASAFLGRICLPAAEEFGLLLRDKVSGWRASNVAAISKCAEATLNEATNASDLHAHPRLVGAIIEHGSWADDGTLQNMWGGLLASSCSPDGRDDSNLIFVGLLNQLTGLQIRVLSYACVTSEKGIGPHGLITVKAQQNLHAELLLDIAGCQDIHRVDRELDHLRGLELLHGGFQPEDGAAIIKPSPLGLNLYVRCQGFRGSAVEYFGLLQQGEGASTSG